MKKGEILKIGSYFPDEEAPKKAEWIVLKVAKEGDRALVIAKNGMECIPYKADGAETTWETSDVRAFLNGEFFETAFNKTEQKKILSTTVSTPCNAYGVCGGADTTDKVFLLSAEEAEKLFKNEEKRRAWSNARVYLQAGYINSEGECGWLLRTPGYDKKKVACVLQDGNICVYGGAVDVKVHGIRPAMWVKI